MSVAVQRLPIHTDPMLGTLAPNVVIRARSPLRVSFCGGGTDLLPYAEEHGGLVLSATIARYAYATLRLLTTPSIRIRSRDYEAMASYGVDETLVYDGKFDLVKACLRRLRLDADSRGCGLDLYLETEAPPGSGLGASSALMVAMIGAFQEWRRLNLSRYQVAQLAYALERKDVGIAGGMQDQYAAAFGGFNLIEFHGEDDVVVNPLRVEDHIVHELEYNSLLVFTGVTRNSGKVIRSQVAKYKRGDPGSLAALTRMKQLVWEAKAALLRGQLVELGRILNEQWEEKKRTSSAVTNEIIDALYEEALQHGAVGGKVSGAGAGGFLYLICPFDRKREVAERLSARGGQVCPVEFEPSGMQSWLASPLHDLEDP